jgi:ParB-like chromosome segregation protein Spo0J
MKRLGERRVSLTDLGRFPGNSRIHADTELKASVKRFGQYKPLTVRVLPDKSYVILAGNGTADALAAAGYTEADCALLECDDLEARQINLADNRLSDLASDDKDALAELLSYLDEDYEGTGWSSDAVAKIIDPPPPGEDDAGLDDVGTRWGVIVECGSEDEQLRLLDELGGQGLNVRALMA